MKKILSVLICFALIFSLSITAFAAASAALNGVPSELKKDSTATITVSVSGSPTASSALVQVTLGSGLELVSGQWKKSGIMQDFNASAGEGVIALSSAGSFDGTVFSFVVKGKTPSATAQNIDVTLTFKNGSSTAGEITASGKIKVVCTTHNYGSYVNANTTNHTRTCSECGAVETKTHTWNSGTVTKTANCKETGTKTFTCTACQATKTETIAKTTNHTFGAWTQTKAPTCTAKGTETRTCSTCQKVETRDVAATGHSMGAWTPTKEATCEAKGQQTRNCSKCSHTETKDIAALGHKFSNPTITKQPTCTETGIESGKCTRCNKETTNTIAATGHKIENYTVTLEPSCTATGKKEGVCTTCSAKVEETIAMIEHSFGEAVITKEATETETGIKTATCSVCGEVKEEAIPVISIEVAPTEEPTTNEGNTDIENEEQNEPNNFNSMWIIIPAAIIVVGTGVAFIVLKKKKA